MTLVLALVGTLTGLAALAISFATHRSSGPLLKVSLYEYLRLGNPRRGGVTDVYVVNKGRVPAVIKYVTLRSTTGTVEIPFDITEGDSGPPLPMTLDPTDSASWLFYDDDVRRRLRRMEPADTHVFRGIIRSMGKVVKSRPNASLASEPGAPVTTRRRRAAHFRNSLKYANLQPAGVASSPELLAAGLQRLAVKNFSRSPAFNLRVDCIAWDKTTDEKRLVRTVHSQRRWLMFPQTSRHFWVPVDFPEAADSERFMWRIRWRRLFGGEASVASTTILRSHYERELALGRPLVVPGLAGDAPSPHSGWRVWRQLHRKGREEADKTQYAQDLTVGTGKE